MPRIRNTKAPVKKTKESNVSMYIIISILLVQTIFLFYKNFDYMQDIFASNGNEYSYENYEEDIHNSDIDTTADHTGEYAEINRPVRVSILNGCGVKGLAGKWQSKLRDREYDIRETGNADKKYINSIVLSRIKNMKPAFDLAKNLGIPDKDVILQINKDIVDIDVTLILGKDYKKLK